MRLTNWTVVFFCLVISLRSKFDFVSYFFSTCLEHRFTFGRHSRFSRGCFLFVIPSRSRDPHEQKESQCFWCRIERWNEKRGTCYSGSWEVRNESKRKTFLIIGLSFQSSSPSVTVKPLHGALTARGLLICTSDNSGTLRLKIHQRVFPRMGLMCFN